MSQVLIVGAGATGLTLAIELLRRNIPVRLIDLSTEPFSGSRGKGIQPRSLEILDMMGIVDVILESSTLYPFLKIHLGPITFKAGSLGTHHAPTEDRPHPNLVMVAQWRTEEILRAQLASLGGHIERGLGLESLHQNDHEVVVTLTTKEHVKADYVVGCDGGRSATRNALGVTLYGNTLDDKTSIVADLEVEGLDREFWHAWPLRRGGLRSLAPLPGGTLFQLQAPEGIAINGVERGVERLTGKRVTRVGWQSRYQHQTRMVDRYRVGRVLLGGDAAHIHPPSGGQGLNTGLQDAWNLGWKLAAAIRTGDQAILDTYEAERLPIAAAMLDMTKTLHVRNSFQRGELTNQLGVGYRNSSLAHGASTGEIFPGDRMPDQRLADGRRLFEVMRHGGATQVMRPKRDHILVRPDGYVAEIVDKEITNYFGYGVVQVEAAP